MSQPDNGPMRSEPQDRGKGSGWPLSVRVLAVAYVLSYPAQGLAVLGLGGAAAILFGLGYPLDAWLVGLKVGSVACFALCGAYRWWFVRWSRKHYPSGSPK